MPNIGIRAINHERAKSSAQAVKRRLGDLGHSVCLNHAYEALAASLGFKTWAIMKSRLDGADEVPVAESIQHEAVSPEFADQAGLRWRDLKLDRFNPVAMIHGPSGPKRDYVTRLFIGGLNSVGRRFAYIGDGLAAKQEATKLSKGFLASSNAAFEFHAIDLDRSINIFDLPLGAIRPSDTHRSRIVYFLKRLIELDQPCSSLDDILRHLVDEAYDYVFDESRATHGRFHYQSMPSLSELEAFCRASGIKLEEHGTRWIDLANAIGDKGEQRLAGQAMRYAVPVIETLMTIVRSEPFRGNYGHIYVKGESILNRCLRSFSSAIREFPFLRGPTVSDFGANAFQVIGVHASKADTKAKSLLYFLAYDRCSRSAKAFGSEDVIVLSGAEVIREHLKDLLDQAHNEGPMVILSPVGCRIGGGARSTCNNPYCCCWLRLPGERPGGVQRHWC